MRRRISGSDWIAAGALVLALAWLVAWAAGSHPDDALLAFAGTMLVVWASREKEARQREEIEERDRDPDRERRQRTEDDSE